MSWFRRGHRRPAHLRVALLGAGGVAGVHGLAARTAGHRVVAVASAEPALAAARAGETGGRPMGVDELVDHADELADLVIVTVPVAVRGALVQRLLDTGRAPASTPRPIVLVEPPMCATLAEADELVRATSASLDRVRYGEHLLHAPAMRGLLARLGAVGELTHLEVVTSGAGHDEQVHPLADLGPRAVALAFAVADRLVVGRPVEVTARDDGAGGAAVELAFAAGAVVRLQVGRRTDGERMWHVQAAGTTGVVRAELLPFPSLDATGTAAGTHPPERGHEAVVALGYTGQLGALTDPGPGAPKGPVPNAALGRDVVEVVSAACRSLAREGTPSALPYSGPRGVEPHALVRGG